jgi:hypothetical protein
MVDEPPMSAILRAESCTAVSEAKRRPQVCHYFNGRRAV